MFSLLAVSFEEAGKIFANFFTVVKNDIFPLSPSDLVDILLLSIILFLGYRFIRGRKAGALLIGTLVCIILMFAAEIFNLSATLFVFSEVFKIGIIVLLIIFQPEIRDALEKIGTGSINTLKTFGEQRRKRAQFQTAINNICTAVVDLAATKTGALIVMARTTKLDDIVETGITINADVNSSLLRNLFYNKAPLHDGAVIIDDSRIVAASCLLPLTRRTDIDNDLGTRHRAAIGMSEASDAVIIVVSEETGTISVAYDCSLRRDFTYESLNSYLNEKLLGIRPSDLNTGRGTKQA